VAPNAERALRNGNYARAPNSRLEKLPAMHRTVRERVVSAERSAADVARGSTRQ
jgi:hypothetical protein